MKISVNATERELNWLLDRELDKPIKEIDTSFIDFIVDVLLADVPDPSPKEVANGIAKILKRVKEHQEEIEL